MLTFKDCLDYCELSEDEVMAIAHHERMTEIDALAYAYKLQQVRTGETGIAVHE